MRTHTKRLQPVWIMMGALGLSACASSSVEQPVSNYFNCEGLKSAVADAPNEFRNIRVHGQTSRYAEIWDTRTQAFGHSCSIVEGGNTVYYTCSGQIEPEASQTQLETASSAVKQCLGTQWQSSTSDNGDVLMRSEDPTAPMVMLNSFRNDRDRQMIRLRINAR